MKKLLAIECIIIFLAGCSATGITYYKPLGPGSYFKTQCGGPDELLGFEVSDGLGVMVDTSSLRSDKNKAIVTSFHLGEAHTLEFVLPEFIVVAGESKKVKKYPFSEVVSFDYVKHPSGGWTTQKNKISINTKLYGELLPSRFRSVLYVSYQNYRAFSVKIPIGKLGKNGLMLEFPRILLDGHDVDIPDINIEYGERMHMSFIC